jgi:outer membrane lipoprotein-sorting protein
VQADKPEEGALTMEFSDKPLQLRQMVVEDARGQRTNISLQNATFGQPLPDSLFKFEDPRGIGKRRRDR